MKNENQEKNAEGRKDRARGFTDKYICAHM